MITLNLKIKDQDIELTMDEARELYKELKQVLGKDDVINPFPMPYIPPMQPERTPWERPPIITYTDAAGMTASDKLKNQFPSDEIPQAIS